MLILIMVIALGTMLKLDMTQCVQECYVARHAAAVDHFRYVNKKAKVISPLTMMIIASRIYGSAQMRA